MTRHFLEVSIKANVREMAYFLSLKANLFLKAAFPFVFHFRMKDFVRVDKHFDGKAHNALLT
jgi:hypothetical protein